MSTRPSKQELLRQLRGKLKSVKNPQHHAERGALQPHRILIDEFFPRGAQGGLLVEWMSSKEGTGASTIAFLMAREEQRRGSVVVVIDPAGEFDPPAAQALEMNVASLIVVQPRSQNEALWAWEQSLRTRGTTVIGPLDRVPVHALRRLKLAVEQEGGLALMLRPLALWSEPSWADLRLVATPSAAHTSPTGLFSRKVSVQPVYVRGEFGSDDIIVDISDETASLSLDPQLAHPTADVHPARAS